MGIRIDVRHQEPRPQQHDHRWEMDAAETLHQVIFLQAQGLLRSGMGSTST